MEQKITNQERGERLKTFDRVLNFTIIAVLFYPSLLGPLFGTDKFGADNIVLNWGIIVACYVGVFLIMEMRRKTVSVKTLKIVNLVFLIELLSFALSFGFVGLYKNTMVYFPSTIFLLVITSIIYFLPLVLFVGLLGEWIYRGCDDLIKVSVNFIDKLKK
jgi:hypothetical protein